MLLLTFRAAENQYAVDVSRVAEVLPRVQLRRLPHSPSYLAGVFDYRGVVVPVVDLGILLGGEGCRDRLSTRVIVVDLRPNSPAHPDSPGGEAGASEAEAPGRPGASPRRLLAGIIAEQVSDVAKIRPEQVISPPMSLPEAPYLGEIVEIGQDMTQLIVPGRLLDRGFRESFFGPADPHAAGPSGRHANEGP